MNAELWTRLQNYRFDSDHTSFSFSDRLREENGWSREFTARVLEEYKRFLKASSSAGSFSLRLSRFLVPPSEREAGEAKEAVAAELEGAEAATAEIPVAEAAAEEGDVAAAVAASPPWSFL